MPSTPATWFDGRSSQARAVQLQLVGDQLQLDDGEQIHSLAARSLGLTEVWQNGASPVALPAGGGTLWLDDAARPLLNALQRVQQPRPAWGAHRLARSWPTALTCLLLLLGLLLWFSQSGAGWMARAAMPLVPLSIDRSIGEKAWPQIEAQWLRGSRHRERCSTLALRFHPLAEAFNAGPLQLECRRLQNSAGFNAFALPGGRIVLLDGLLDQLDDDEVLAVLGHELGHVSHRHGMQGLVRSFALVAVAGGVLGDFSTVAATAAAGLQGLSYSRDAEREADAFALRFVAHAGLPATVMQQVWRKFAAEENRQGGGLPTWLSSHPPTEERLRAAQ
jgi:Zn-dependent protease with chaperone function